VRFTVDSNVLVYALVRDPAEKHRVAADLMIRAMTLDAVLCAQALAEFLNVIRRKQPSHFDAARAQAERWATVFTVADTSAEHVLRAGAFAARHRLQLCDSLIWQVARSSHAAFFLSEDLQDGLSIDGMTVLNPFNPGNRERLREILTGAPGTG
jgi:predicted nucleic acid-binding protein